MARTVRLGSESESQALGGFASIHQSHSRTHSRSASWSPAALSHAQSSSSMALFSPMRIIQGIVPGLSGPVTGPALSSSSVVDTVPASGADGSSASLRTRTNASASSMSHHSRQSSSVVVDIPLGSAEPEPDSSQESANSSSSVQRDQVEFFGTLSWIEKALPFIILLLTRIMWDHRLGLLVFIGLFGTFFHVNSTIRKQVALKERRLNRVSSVTFLFLFTNIFFIYYVFKKQNLENCLMFQKGNFSQMDLWTVVWCIVITDFVVRFCAMALKCVVIVLPRRLVQFRKRGKFFLLVEQVSQTYRILLPMPQWYYYFSTYNSGGEYFAVVATSAYFLLKARMVFLKRIEFFGAFKSFWKDTRYGRSPSKEQVLEAGDACPICQEKLDDPIELTVCRHIFCEDCIVMWFDRERTCPMCRAKVAEDPSWRDGNTQAWVQLF